MHLTPVDGSTTVRAAGYDSGVITILFHSGHWRSYPGTEADYADFRASESKGRFVRERLTPPAEAVPQGRRPLATYEIDPCCGKALGKALASGSLKDAEEWACPRCGVEWIPEHLADGMGKHWKPRVWVARLK